MMRATGWTLSLLLAASTLQAQDFQWSGRVEQGKTLEIRGVNGSIVASGTSGNTVRVTARKTAEDDNPEDVRIEVVEHEGGVTICAVYPAPRRDRRPNTCEPGSGGRMNVDNNDVKVHFEVQMPAGITFVGRNVNGNVEVDDVQGDVRAYTVNGDVDIEAGGIAEAKTVNGGIRAAMGSSRWNGEVNLETVNGDIILDIEGELDANVRAQTVNGGITTDYPLTVQGRFGPKSVRGTIGQGGGTLALNTVNGSIELRRR